MQILIYPTVVVVIVLVAVAAANWPVTVECRGKLPAHFPDSGFSHQTFEVLLQDYVNSSGEVDYGAWHASPESMTVLEDYLAAIAAFSPLSAPGRFASKNDELAYWMYGYNAYVIKNVLDNWPIESVTDLKAPVEAVTGLGFFYRNRYVFGGKALSLLAVENGYIRKRYRDPRIHFVLNCASASCPVLRPELPTGDELERLLAAAAEQFVAEPRNVYVDHEQKLVRLSAIFKMYRRDFENHVIASGLPARDGVLAYISGVAPGELRGELERARGYKLVFEEFDWTINSQKVSSPHGT